MDTKTMNLSHNTITLVMEKQDNGKKNGSVSQFIFNLLINTIGTTQIIF